MNMRNLALIITAFIISGCNVESAAPAWQMEESGKFDKYHATLECKIPPDTGTFQNCQVTFKTATGAKATLQSVLVDGGMPAHGHGMPTTPVLQLQNDSGSYRIDGLKFNMPGAWLLGFQLEGELGSDQVIFDFVI